MSRQILRPLGAAAILIAGVLLASAAPVTTTGATADREGWQGPPSGSGMPPPEILRLGREACASTKQAAWRAASRQSLLEDNPQREDDPRTVYDVTYYGLDLSVFQGASSLSGTVRVDLTLLQNDVTVVTLDAAPNLTIGTVLQSGETVVATHDGPLLNVQLVGPLDEGDNTVLEIAYTAQFNGCGVLSTWRNNVQTGQSVHTITTQAEPFDARCWWPCKDDTRDKADSTRIRVTTDDFNTVVSNGTLQSNVNNGNGTRTVTWFESWPMVTYLVSLCVTEYNHAQATWSWNDVSMPMHDWSWGLSTGDQQAVLDVGLSALTALSDRYGQYPFADEKYGHAQYTWGGAMEHQTCSSMGFYSESVIAHELAHQWFGDKITCNTFHHIWLNEGWATYSEAIYFEQLYGEEALHEYMGYEAYMGPGTIYVENPYTDNIFDGNLSYAKGSWVLHMLRHVMGDEAFWTAVHAYLGPNEAESHRTADTDQFRAFMEAEHGDDLGWFFDEWIMGEYWPDYAYHWTVTPVDDQFLLEVAVIQRQVPARQLFRMPIDLRLTYAGGATETLFPTVDRAAMAFSMLLPAQPVSVALDPEGWILGQVTELDAPPPTAILVDHVRLLDGQGQPIVRLPAGGEFRLVCELSNLGNDSGPLQVALGSTHPDVTINGPTVHEGLGFGESAELEWNGTTLDGVSGMVAFALSVSWNGGLVGEEWVFPAGQPEVLLVDDDGGAEFQTWFQGAMNGAMDYVTIASDSLPADLSPFTLVLWMTGNNRRALAEEEWALADAYVNGGGHLVFTGQNFADAQSPADLASHCGVEILNDSYDNNAVVGTEGGLFAGRSFYLFNGGAGNQTEMDVISGMLDCMSPQATYHNLTTGSAAEELWCGEGALMVFGFGLEGVASIGNGITLRQTLGTLLDWAHGNTAVEPAPRPRPGPLFSLTSAHPNPFNPATSIHWESGRAGVLQGEIVNLAGQRVATFEPRTVPQGSGALSWQPRGQASGLYLARLQLQTADGERHAATLKLMLLQ